MLYPSSLSCLLHHPLLPQQFVLLQSEVLYITFTQINPAFLFQLEKGHNMSHFSKSIDVSCTELEET